MLIHSCNNMHDISMQPTYSLSPTQSSISKVTTASNLLGNGTPTRGDNSTAGFIMVGVVIFNVLIGNLVHIMNDSVFKV